MLGRISSSRMFVWMCVLLLGRAGMTNAYWYGECVRDPGQWALPDNHELDCSLRQLTLTHSVDLLGRVTVVRSPPPFSPPTHPLHLPPASSTSLLLSLSFSSLRSVPAP